MQKNSYLDYKEIIAETVGTVLAESGVEKEALYALIEYPPDEKLGDLALPCFQLSKVLRKAPNLIAEELENKIDPAPYFEAVKATGPYLNFYVAPVPLVKDVLAKIITSGSKYGARSVGGGQNIVIDFSAPNIAKPFHVGHLCSTVIGNALYKIFEFLGYNFVSGSTIWATGEPSLVS